MKQMVHNDITVNYVCVQGLITIDKIDQTGKPTVHEKERIDLN